MLRDPDSSSGVRLHCQSSGSRALFVWSGLISTDRVLKSRVFVQRWPTVSFASPLVSSCGSRGFWKKLLLQATASCSIQCLLLAALPPVASSSILRVARTFLVRCVCGYLVELRAAVAQHGVGRTESGHPTAKEGSPSLHFGAVGQTTAWSDRSIATVLLNSYVRRTAAGLARGALESTPSTSRRAPAPCRIRDKLLHCCRHIG